MQWLYYAMFQPVTAFVKSQENFSKPEILLLLKLVLLEVNVLQRIFKFQFKSKTAGKAETARFCKFSLNWCCVCVPVTVHLIGSCWQTTTAKSVTHTQTVRGCWGAEMETRDARYYRHGIISADFDFNIKFTVDTPDLSWAVREPPPFLAHHEDWTDCWQSATKM